jgi:xanthine dehydrogenase molybdenum-binding subunit
MSEKEKEFQAEGATPPLRVVGTNPPRTDGIDKVTGMAKFGADLHPAGMLYGAVLRSPHAHARILLIDASQAEAMDGVKAIVTSADLPGVSWEENRYQFCQSCNILAGEKVLYHGHAVAAVAATSPHIAEEALKKIVVRYEFLLPVLDVQKAMQPDSPLVLDNLYTDELGSNSTSPSNIAGHIRIETGDVEVGFAQAEVIVEREFTTAMVHQGYIEPHSSTAVYHQDGQVTIWTTTQGAFDTRNSVAEILDIPVYNIQVIPMEIGGGFGGKNRVYLEPLAVALSKKSGSRPVKLTMSRSEEFTSTGPNSGSSIKVKMGAKKDGTITAAQATLVYEAGAFPGSPVGSGVGCILAPYRIENVLIDGYDVLVNKPWVSSYRAPGGTNAVFAGESMVDELCRMLGMDPIDFRLHNAVKEGDLHSYGFRFGPIGLIDTLQAAANHPHYNTPKADAPGILTGRGVASGYWGNYGGRSSAVASLNNDGTVNLSTGSVDLSGTRTSLAIQLAETLGIPAEKVHPQVADTDSISYTEGSYGSRTTFATGLAVIEAGQKMLRELTGRAAQLLEVDAGELVYKDGHFTTTDSAPGSSRKSMSFEVLARRLDETGGPVIASAAILADSAAPAFTTQIVDIGLDPDTGKVDILRYTAIQDVGKAVYPIYVEGQIQGGVTQGIGWGLNEGYLYDAEGSLVNTSLLDYRLATSLDLPMIDTVLVEVPHPDHPYGVRGVGEAPILPPPAAIASAIADAAGVRLAQLPMSPDRILEALLSRDDLYYTNQTLRKQ